MADEKEKIVQEEVNVEKKANWLWPVVAVSTIGIGGYLIGYGDGEKSIRKRLPSIVNQAGLRGAAAFEQAIEKKCPKAYEMLLEYEHRKPGKLNSLTYKKFCELRRSIRG